MNEDEWLNCRRADTMLRWLLAPGDAGRISERKLRLFACACGRRRPDGGPVADVVEDWVEGRVPVEERDARLRSLGFASVQSLLGQGHLDLPPDFIVEALRTGFGILHGYEAGLLREVVGNPFRPAALPPALLAWNDGTLRRLAETIAMNRTYGDMPILGDALEESGCADERLAVHCREKGPHVAGCWVLDAILGKK